ncbi:hypothetical protein ACTID9_22680 [Brevibacillus fluminis]|uniref:hypothetical protein n=1 Tax=Brevibacillus fluminis TaxID=511487 RepID=UPI003F88FE89
MYAAGQGLRSIANQLNTVVIRRYCVCDKFKNNGSRACSSNSVRADFVESYVMERIAEVVLQPKVLDDVVNKINKDRTKSVTPLQKEIVLLEKELKTLDTQKQKYFKLYESDTIDNDFLLERLYELKGKYNTFTQRKREAERQLESNSSTPLPPIKWRGLLLSPSKSPLPIPPRNLV